MPMVFDNAGILTEDERDFVYTVYEEYQNKVFETLEMLEG
jgi:hypothetical protein